MRQAWIVVEGETSLGQDDHSHDSPFEPLTRHEIDALLNREPTEVFKSDARSRVWSVGDGDGRYVVKRFEYSPWRQRVGRLLGIHPGQREIRAGRWMAVQGIPVVPVVGTRGVAGRLHLVTRFGGPTLGGMARDRQLCGPGVKCRVLASVSRLIVDLVGQGISFRDLKTSNMVVDERGGVWLIDTGSARRSWDVRDSIKMIAMLEHTAELDGILVRDRLRCLWSAVRDCERLGPWREVLGSIREVVVQYGARRERDERRAGG